MTSEGKAVLEIDLRAVGDQFVLTYWESQAADLAVYARYLKADGTIGSKARLIANQSPAVKVFPYPQVLSVPGKGLAIAYVANRVNPTTTAP